MLDRLVPTVRTKQLNAALETTDEVALRESTGHCDSGQSACTLI
jgi:hypothetical protein